MVRVYFEDGKFSELVAYFANEELYLACLPALELAASMQDMFVTESIVTDTEIDELD